MPFFKISLEVWCPLHGHDIQMEGYCKGCQYFGKIEGDDFNHYLECRCPQDIVMGMGSPV